MNSIELRRLESTIEGLVERERERERVCGQPQGPYCRNAKTRNGMHRASLVDMASDFAEVP